MGIEHLEMRQKNLEAAQSALEIELTGAFPSGSEVLVKLSSIQKELTQGTVIGHGTGQFAGELKLRLHTRKNMVRDFPWGGGAQ